MTPPKRPITDSTPPASMLARSALVDKIKVVIAANRWTQQHAASLCGLTQPRISNLLRGNVSRFSLDALVNVTAALERHSQLQKGVAMEYTEEEGQRMVAAFMAELATRPVKGRYPVATESSTTERGGRVIATSEIVSVGGRVALVGDIVRYADGSESRIISGAGIGLVYKGMPMALVGSELDNGDKINGLEHNGLTIYEYADGKIIDGLFERGYVPLQSQ